MYLGIYFWTYFSDHLVISHGEFQSFCRFPIQVNWLSQPPRLSRRLANTLVAATKPASAKPDLQQSSFPKYFSTASSISESCYRFFDPSKRFKRLVSRCYSFTTDAKNSCTNLTAKICEKSKSVSYLTFPNPPLNSYVIAILKYRHKNVSVCYGCSGCFRENG